VTTAADTPEIGAVKDAYLAAIQAEASQAFNSIASGVNLDDVIEHFRVGLKDARLARDSITAVLNESGPTQR
jgi:hypothetical protein